MSDRKCALADPEDGRRDWAGDVGKPSAYMYSIAAQDVPDGPDVVPWPHETFFSTTIFSFPTDKVAQ